MLFNEAPRVEGNERVTDENTFYMKKRLRVAYLIRSRNIESKTRSLVHTAATLYLRIGDYSTILSTSSSVTLSFRRS